MATVGKVNTKWVLDTSPFVGEAKRAADQFKRIVREIAKSAKVPAIEFERDVRRSVTTGTPAEMRRERRAAMAEVQRARYDPMGTSGLADPSRPEFAMNNIRSLSSKEAAGVTAEQSLAKQAAQLEKFAKVTLAARAGLAAVQGVTAAWKGDWEGVQEAINKLPFGIGEVARTVSDLKAEWAGAKAEIEAYNEQAKRTDADTAFRKNVADVTKGAREAAAGRITEIRREAGGIGLEGFERDRYQVQADEQARVEALMKAREDAIKSAGVDVASKEAAKISAAYDEAIAAERQLSEAKLRQIDKEEAQKRLDDQREIAKEQAKEREKAEKDAAEAAERQAQEEQRISEKRAAEARKAADVIQQARMDAMKVTYGQQTDVGITGEGAMMAMQQNLATVNRQIAAAGQGDKPIDLKGAALVLLQQIAANTGKDRVAVAG